uniref:Tail assembly chaperone protein n=1 Tax=Siphoviridae sp. ctREU2 TaxID=2826333 RepID=A0A8S5NK43_9CAUD|nr:MAG TPA: tail assembly chaperone protein [Siphoviridae sp. ctREU2]
MKVTIKDKTYKIKYSIRAMFVFEKLTGKLFKLESLMDWYIFYYSMILAGNPECTLLFDDFIDECDLNPVLVADIQNYLNAQFQKQGQLEQVKEEDTSKKK